MVRIIHTADLHLGLSFAQPNVSPSFEELRFKDLISNLDFMKNYAIENNADFFIIAGDIFHNPRPSVLAFNEFSRIVGELVHNNIDVIVVLGNHDSHRARESLSYLKSYVNVRLERFHLFDVAGAKLIEKGGRKIKFIGLPYPHFQSSLSYGDFLSHFENKFKEIKASIKEEDFTIVVGHFFVEGGKIGSEHLIASLRDYPIPSQVFEDVDLVCLGHLHLPQQIGEKIFYAGSIERIDFGEENENKSFLDIELNDNIDVKRIPLRMRPMKTIYLDFSNFTGFAIGENDILDRIGEIEKGSILRLRIKLRSAFQRPSVRTLEKNLREKLGLSLLKIEVIKEEIHEVSVSSKTMDFMSYLEEYLARKYKNESKEILELVKKEAKEIIAEVESRS